MYWRLRNDSKVFVYKYDGEKPVQVPRALTKHLDGETESNIEYWIEQYKLTHKIIELPRSVLTHRESLALVDKFAAYITGRGNSYKTVCSYKQQLTQHVLPYFVEVHKLTTPNYWPRVSVGLLEFLENKQFSGRLINVCNVALRRFWQWLLEERLVSEPILLRNAIIGRSDTPLSYSLKPEEVLAYRSSNPSLRLIALIGYGFSLRPQEVLALTPRSFIGGSRASVLECAQVMKKYSLYSKLVVNVTRQRNDREYSVPKMGSKGLVACFNEQIAVEIVSALQGINPDQLLFDKGVSYYYKKWRRNGIPGITMKDLRRASIYHLGHYLSIDFTALKNHARHSDPSTTALYIRRPGEDVGEWQEIDLGA